MLEAHWPMSKKYWKLYKYVFGACWFLWEQLRKRKLTTFRTESAGFVKVPVLVVPSGNPTSRKRTETLSAGIGIPLVTRLTSFPMYDPSLNSQEKPTSKSAPKARKRISLMTAVTPRSDRVHRTSVIHKTTPTKIKPKPWEIGHSCKYLLEMTSCSMCPACQCYVYDEDIMASWSPCESEFNAV